MLEVNRTVLIVIDIQGRLAALALRRSLSQY